MSDNISPNGRSGDLSLPVVNLPAKIPTQRQRSTQSNIPDDRGQRDHFKQLATDYAAAGRVVPPVPMPELREHAAVLRAEAGLDEIYDSYLAILINNAMWRDTLAQVPFDRRLLLMPKCLRVEDRCPAPFDQFGMLCKDCGLCSIQDFAAEAERLGYAVLVAEGSAIVTAMIETGKIEAIVGVSCLNVLEKCYPHMEAAAVPGVAIPLLQDDCANTTVDIDWVWDCIHLTSDDQTWRLDLDELRDDVQSWFERPVLDGIMGPSRGKTEEIARDWLAQDGNRWRPFLSSCVSIAQRMQPGQEASPGFSDDFKKVAIAVECFHKASLVHDDLEDGDSLRYGEPTVHAEHGEAVAINVGDFLLGEGYRLLGEVDVPAETKVALLQTAARGHLTLTRGQGAELCWTREPQPLTSLEVLQIFREKTAPAFEVALELGALHAGADDATLKILREFSESIGIAYQIKDDLEDFTGDSDSNDLEDLRPSLILAIALKRAKDDEQMLIESLWRREMSFRSVEAKVRGILSERQVVEKASELRAAYEEQAVRGLRFLENHNLKGLLRRVVGKIFPRNLVEGYCGEYEKKRALMDSAANSASTS